MLLLNSMNSKMSYRYVRIRSVRVTRILNRQIQSSGSSARDDYEIDLITLKRNAKKRVAQPTPSPLHETKHTQDDIINLSIPNSQKANATVGATIDKTIYELNQNLNNLEVSFNQKLHELESVLKVLSDESKQINSTLLSQLKENAAQKPNKFDEIDIANSSSSPKATIKINREDLESFLQHAKQHKDRQEAEYFRVVRALETSIPRLRSLEKKNFFTPINENLSKKLTKRGTFPSLEVSHGKDELLFPTMPKHDENNIHEFMILSPNDPTPIISKTNPLDPRYHKPDLVTMIQKLGSHHDSYWTQILKYEKQRWNLIATEGYEDQTVLIFERYITKDELTKMKRKKWYKLATGIMTFGTGLYLFAYYLEQDESRPLVKKTVVS